MFPASSLPSLCCSLLSRPALKEAAEMRGILLERSSSLVLGCPYSHVSYAGLCRWPSHVPQTPVLGVLASSRARHARVTCGSESADVRRPPLGCAGPREAAGARSACNYRMMRLRRGTAGEGSGPVVGGVLVGGGGSGWTGRLR